jgi:hypothetical protein
MAEWSDPRVTQTGAGVTIDGKPIASTAVDAGLRAHMLKVYNYMASGVLLTGIVAMLFANSGMAAQVMATPLRWLIILSPLAFIMVMSFGTNKLSHCRRCSGRSRRSWVCRCRRFSLFTQGNRLLAPSL